MWPRDGSIERSPAHGELLPVVPACGGAEPAGTVASGNRRATAGSRGRRIGGGAGRHVAKAVSERPSSRGPAGKRATADLAVASYQGGGSGGRQLPPDRGALERQLAPSGRL